MYSYINFYSLQLFVNLTDRNDNSPVFPTFPIVEVDEDQRVGSTIFTITATDADQGMNAALAYSIVSGNTNGQLLFRLNRMKKLLVLFYKLDLCRFHV